MPDLSEIQATLANGDIQAALELLDQYERTHPDDVDGLYLKAVACRYAKAFDTALDALSRIKVLMPVHSRAWQEEGHVLRDCGEPRAALQAYSQAIALNPALLASFRESVVLLKHLGLHEQAQNLLLQQRKLEQMPAPLVSAIDLLSQNKLLKAENLCRRFLQQHPQHVEGCLLYTSPSPRDKRQSRMPSSA